MILTLLYATCKLDQESSVAMARDKAFEGTDKGVDRGVEKIDRNGMYVNLLFKLEKELEEARD